MPLLKYGDTGKDVKILQSLLQSQGYFNAYTGGNFKTLTRTAVVYWQQTHLGPDGKFLEPDGVVGPKTWWSLFNPVGAPQKSNIKGKVVSGLGEERKKFLEVALHEHEIGVKEIPDGSNWGDGVTKYLEGIGAAFWCAYFVSWCHKEAFSAYPLNTRHGHCLTFWRAAQKAGVAKSKKSYEPIPGDIFIMLYKTSSGNLSGAGHTGIVLSVAPDGKSFNTIEGNAGNRVKVGVRDISQGTLEGFISLHPQEGKYEKKLFASEKLDSSFGTTR